MQKEQSNESKHTKSFSNGNYLNTVAFLGAVIAIGWSIYCRIPSSISISNDTENIPILNNDYDKMLEKGIEYEVEKLPVFHRRSNLYNITAFNHCDADEMTTCVKDVMTFNEREITGELDPNLTPMTYSIYKSDGTIEKGNTLVYKRPSISTFYPDFGPDANISPMKPRFNGFAAKFFNLSPWFLKLYWEGNQRVLMSTIPPYQAHGMATFPSHRFVLTRIVKGNGMGEIDIKSFSANPNDPLNVFNAIADGHIELSSLSKQEKDMYFEQFTNIEFAKRYKEFTGNEWLAMFPKAIPTYPMWRADYFGQQHSIVSKETHFISVPPSSLLPKLNYRKENASSIRNNIIKPLLPFRGEGDLVLNITVLSCAPRVFEVKNFLSNTEVEHILDLGTSFTLKESSVDGGSERHTKIRTSKNTWIHRTSSPIVDAVYRRAADLLGIDEAMFRSRSEEEIQLSDRVDADDDISENLQLVHYDVGQEYTAHHDFAYPKSSDSHQPARFVTVLLYLNEGMQGGQTTFPRWRNKDTSDELYVLPEVGKAVFFYSSLPDGNYDDFSQHAAKPVRKGEKWLTNLWVWDPVRP